MISVIICSISPDLASAIEENIKTTIGKETEYEMIIWDNRALNRPIAYAYNSCAKKAVGNNLLFVHEDVVFLSNGWGKMIEEKLSEPDCGVIGFAGSIVKPAVYSGWLVNKKYERSHYWYLRNGEKTFYQQNMPSGVHFSPVVTLDGLGFFVRKSVHDRFPFDEKNLVDFHCYDIDYTLQIARHYKNYCCDIDVLHKSNGCFNIRWVTETIKLHDTKWNSFLPIAVEGASFSKAEMKRINDDALWYFFKSSCRFLSPSLAWKNLTLYSKLPLSFQHIRRVISGTMKIIRRARRRMRARFS